MAKQKSARRGSRTAALCLRARAAASAGRSRNAAAGAKSASIAGTVARPKTVPTHGPARVTAGRRSAYAAGERRSFRRRSRAARADGRAERRAGSSSSQTASPTFRPATQSGGLAVARRRGAARLRRALVRLERRGRRRRARPGSRRSSRSATSRTVTVALTPEEHDSYYLGFANRCLWPLFHYRLDLADLRTGPEATYFAVNKRFAKEVAPLLEPRRHDLGARLSAHPASPPICGSGR